ncbi:MAG: hypothetical protein U0L74_01290 [Paludibacteraceae bacterium]|nr:hypothetical protein [Paludibacteraceae bacterium]
MKRLWNLLLCLGLLFCVSEGWAQDLDQISLKRGLKVSGGLNFNNTFYNGSDSLIKRDPYQMMLSGNLNFNLWGISLPFSFSYTNSTTTYTQPFNRFKLAPKYKWVKLHLIDGALNFSQYTLAGRQFRGAGVELTPGNWYVGAMYGRLAKAVEYDPMVDNLETVAYKRMGYGLKVGYAAEKTDVNVTFFSAEDDVKSLKFDVPPEADLHPQKNTAVSAYLRQSFLKYFYVQAEYAFSVYNSEIRSESGDTVRSSNFIDKLFNKSGNDRYVDAVSASVGYQNPVWGVALCYERVAPDYQTLGGYYFSNDLENFSIAPNVKLFEGMFSLSGKLGFEYNNLNSQRADDTKRVVSSANVSFSSGKAWTASLAYSNFSTYTKYRKTAYPYYSDDLDSLNFYQVSQSLNAMVGYSFGDEEQAHSVSLTASYQNGESQKEEKAMAMSDIVSSSLSYTESFSPIELSWSAFFSVNYADVSDMESLYWGPGLNCSKAFFDNKLNGSLSCAYNFNDVNGESVSSLLNSSLSLQYSLDGIDKKFGNHSITASANLTNRFKTSATNNGHEFLATINYGVSF